MKREAGGDGVEVLAEESCETAGLLRSVLLRLADPLGQQEAAPVAAELGEGSDEVAGPGDVRAGDALAEQASFEFGWESVLRSHDPAGDLAGAGYVCAVGFGVPGAERGEVIADDLAAAAVAAFADLQEEAAAADLAETLGEPGVQVRLERIQDSGWLAFVGGGQELVKVGVTEASDSFTVEVESAGDGADGPACGNEFLDACVSAVASGR
ncbi:hypothetical protein OG594_44310 [Streptomyces sp. NBC_01214]|uniref:hypothetical protein n=1 Tax=Streptomyces sp. NBC_01214 TaxID=2903777 RepID=UPI002251430E|nr:hypothetical protein [Streptomyces sp. NBC_01214]MCX4808532.1 hypothetical protein [Streptomyces sp. NBC_01214]